jgi:hypothetical protein
VDPNSFFSDTDPEIVLPISDSDSVSDSDSKTNILTRQFPEVCLSLCSYVFRNLYGNTENKVLL